jgi:hypothetical protein
VTSLSDTQVRGVPSRAEHLWLSRLGDRPARGRVVGHGSLSSRDSASWAAAGGPGGTLDKTQIQDYSPENLERIQRGKEMRDREVQRLRNPEEAEQGHIPLAPLNFADIAAIQAR